MNREIREDRVDLAGDEFGGYLENLHDATCILRGQRSDGARAMDAECSKCLQIGLDAGPAAGVRARDRQCNGDQCRVYRHSHSWMLPYRELSGVMGWGPRSVAVCATTWKL